MMDPFFFGYGSLVNRATHDYGQLHHATLPGWRRVWRQTSRRELAFLTGEPAPGSIIDGVIAAVPGGDWVALDLREAGYDRLPLATLHHSGPTDAAVSVYSIPGDAEIGADAPLPILLSYLDVVVQGYLREFGATGVARFFETTEGWERPILNDRAAPLYPRHQVISGLEQDLVDGTLHDLGADLISG